MVELLVEGSVSRASDRKRFPARGRTTTAPARDPSDPFDPFVIAEHGGTRAAQLYSTLCEKGPFRRVDPSLFIRLLRQLGRSDVALIEQAPDGVLLLGRQGERLVEHYSFFAVFQTPKEYRITAAGKLLGTLPIIMIVTPGMTIIFSGRRWRVIEIHDSDRIIEVAADKVGRPPTFGGDGGIIHDKIVQKMKEILSDESIPIYLDKSAARILDDARSEFRRLKIVRRPICRVGERSCLIATWVGTVKTSTLALALRGKGYTVEVHDGFLDINEERQHPVEGALEKIARSVPVSADSLLSGSENFVTEKFHSYLSRDLLLEDSISSRIDLDALPGLARNLVDGKN